MPNSDTQDGVHNKITKEFRYYLTTDDSVQAQSFSGNVETAKAFFLTDDYVSNNNINGTQVEYAITADGNGLKMTIAFGTKGTAGIAEADDWTGIWSTNHDVMIAAGTTCKARTFVNTWPEGSYGAEEGATSTRNLLIKTIDVTPHLF